MPVLSTIVATFLGLALSSLVSNKLSIWGQLPGSERFWTVFASIYAVLAVITGWGYTASKVRIFGWIHALLMLSVAGLCVVYGFSTLGDRSIAGGRGPDANPVAGIIYGVALLGVIIGGVTGVCGFGVIRHLLRKHTNERPVANQPDANPAIASRLHSVYHWRGVADPEYR